MTGIDEDQQWTFAANDNYWQGRPKLDGIEYRYVDDAAVALEAYRAGDLDIVQLNRTRSRKCKADPELSQAFVSYPSGRHPVPGHEPHPGAVQRQEGARGLCLRHRSRDPLRGAALRRLPADPFLHSGRASRRHRNRPVRLRSRGRQAGAGRIVLRRAGQAAGDQALLQQRLRRARRAVGVDRRRDSRHSGHRAQDRADGRGRTDRPAQGPEDAPAAAVLRQLVPGLPRPAELAQRLLDLRLQS